MTGTNSGTAISVNTGVRIELDSRFEFDLSSIATGPILYEFELFNDIDFRSNMALISDPDDLGGSLAELSALIGPGSAFTVPNLDLGSSAEVGTLDTLGPFVALEFGPVATVPLPASGWALLGMLGAYAGIRRRTSAADSV